MKYILILDKHLGVMKTFIGLLEYTKEYDKCFVVSFIYIRIFNFKIACWNHFFIVKVFGKDLYTIPPFVEGAWKTFMNIN
jgi:hypothetical protein